MIAAKDKPCGGVVVNQTDVTCPKVIDCIKAQPTAAPLVAGDLVIGGDGQKHALPAANTLQPAIGACLDRDDVVVDATGKLFGAAKHYKNQVLLYQGQTGALTATNKILGTYTITNPSPCRVYEGKFEAFLQANAQPPFPQPSDSVLISTSANGLLTAAGTGNGIGPYQTTYGENSSTWFNDFFTIPAGGSLTFDVLARNGAGTTMDGYLTLKYVAHTK